MGSKGISEVVATLVAANLATSGCATIANDASQTLAISTKPPGASCNLQRQDKSIGILDTTPGSVRIDKSSADIVITCRKAGHADAVQILKPSMQRAVLDNLYFGLPGILGLALDGASGAAMEYRPDIQLRLVPERFESIQSRDAYFDSWREELSTASERAKSEARAKCPANQCASLLEDIEAKARVAVTEVDVLRDRATFAEGGPSATASKP